jgi:hypothetical protein
MANQMGMVFSKLNCKPRWRERLPELALRALVVHGRRDLIFPVGNGEVLARAIPGARLLVLEEAASAIPRRRPATSPRQCSCSRDEPTALRAGRPACAGGTLTGAQAVGLWRYRRSRR